MNKPIDSLELEQQIETLREQLHEAEELRRAISHGEVDAFVVGPTEDSKRVLMLSGAYSRYRQLVEDMQQGAVTVTGTKGNLLKTVRAGHAYLRRGNR